MTQSEILNYRLNKAFAELEGLCNQIYGDKHGITCYIDDMTSKPDGDKYVSNWKIQLKRLKGIRHIRNMLDHGEVRYEDRHAEESDVEFLINFKSEIIKYTDPLNLYRKGKKAEEERIGRERRDYLEKQKQAEVRRTQPAIKREPPPYFFTEDRQRKSNNNRFAVFALFIILIILCAATVAVGMDMLKHGI